MANYDFFQNPQCEYFPCHKCADSENFSCLFCYCPLYALGDKCGGNLGQSGSVMFMFNRQGNIVIEKDGVDEDALLETALEAGAEDLVTDEEDVFEVRTQPNDVGAVSEALAAAGYVAISAEAEYIPTTYTRLDNPDDIKNMGKMLEMFEDNDDVQNVWHNWENEEDYE